MRPGQIPLPRDVGPEMKTLLKSIVILAILVVGRSQARSTNMVWMVDFIIGSVAERSVTNDIARIGHALDMVAGEFGMQALTPGQSNVVRIFRADADLLIGLNASLSSNRIVVKTVPMKPVVKTTDAHRRFYSRLEEELRKEVGERMMKEER